MITENNAADLLVLFFATRYARPVKAGVVLDSRLIAGEDRPVERLLDAGMIEQETDGSVFSYQVTAAGVAALAELERQDWETRKTAARAIIAGMKHYGLSLNEAARVARAFHEIDAMLFGEIWSGDEAEQRAARIAFLGWN